MTDFYNIHSKIYVAVDCIIFGFDERGLKLLPIKRGFELLPEKFTIPQLQDLYEAIYQQKSDKRNFRKIIFQMNILEKLEEKNKPGSKKGAFLYRFDKERYDTLINSGDHFNFYEALYYITVR